jgi:hypothetical protein
VVVKHTPLRYFCIEAAFFVTKVIKTVVEILSTFEQKYEEWLELNIKQEENHRRRELLESGLGHGTLEFLRTVWYPAVQHFDHLYPEWEVRDFHNWSATIKMQSKNPLV